MCKLAKGNNQQTVAMGLDKPTPNVVVMAPVDAIRGAGINGITEGLGSAIREFVYA